MPRPRLALLAVSLATVFLLASCADEPTKPAEPAPRDFSGAWQGRFVGSGALRPNAAAINDQGTVLIDLRLFSVGSFVGTIVMASPAFTSTVARAVQGSADATHLRLTSTQGDTLNLEMNPSDSGQLLGTFRLTSPAVSGTLNASKLPLLGLAAQPFLTLSSTVLSMAFDADTLWLSTSTDDYIRLSRGAIVLDTVVVYRNQDTRWTSDVLTSGAGHMWGHLRQSTNGAPSVSEVLQFARGGLLPDSFVLSYLSHGFAHDGTYLWSLDRAGEELDRLSDQGAVLTSLPVENPDLTQLAYDGVHFWSMGWYVPLLYQISRTGEILSVQRLPGDASTPFPAGIATDGEYLYVARTDIGRTVIWRMSATTPIP